LVLPRQVWIDAAERGKVGSGRMARCIAKAHDIDTALVRNISTLVGRFRSDGMRWIV
jgi:hypothetical protein